MPLSAGFVGGHVVAVIGSLMMVIGPFMAWMTALWVSVSGLQKTGNEALVIVILGVIGLAFSAVAVFTKSRRFRTSPLLVGVIGVGLSVWYYVQLRDQLDELRVEDIGIGLGSGIYLCLIGGILVIVGAIVALVGRKS